jgi:hypothetical protein
VLRYRDVGWAPSKGLLRSVYNQYTYRVSLSKHHEISGKWHNGLLFLLTMLRSYCRVSLLPANVALASMNLVLTTIAQCGDNRLRGQGNIDGRAQCDRVHAEGITGAYVVPQEKLKRAKQARSCPMSSLPQAAAL